MTKQQARLILAVSLLLLALLAACGSSNDSSSSGSYPAEMVDRGKGLYLQTCLACHGPDGKGLPSLGKDLTTSEFFRASTEAELIAYVIEGRTANDPLNTTGVAMPPKGGFAFLTEEDIQAIIAFIRSDLAGP